MMAMNYRSRSAKISVKYYFETSITCSSGDTKVQLIVELHWEVSPHLYASSVQAADLWRSLVTTELNGVAIKVLAPEDLIFSLLIHGSRHLWECLLWICDVGWIVETTRTRLAIACWSGREQQGMSACFCSASIFLRSS
jgi:hypothetical protein